MKKRIASFLTLLCLFALLSFPVSAAGFALPESVPVTAAAAYFVNLDTGITVFEKSPHERRSIASLTKLMTALLFIEAVPDLDGTVIKADTSLYVEPITNYDSSTADIRPNEEVTARSVLYGMLLPSGNEAAQIAAYHVSGGNLANFYAMMNARAAQLGCTDTAFTNAHGLIGMEGGNYSSAADLALIATACWQNETFREITTTTSYEMPATNVHDAPYLIQSSVRSQVPGTPVYRSYIRGMKTGSTMSAGRNFVSSAVNDKGETFIGVVLGCPYDQLQDGYAMSFVDTNAIYDWIFANFSVQPTLDVASPLTEVPIKLSSELDVLKLYPAQDLQTILPNAGGGTLLQQEFNVPESLNAPIKQGDVVGSVTVKLSGEVIGTVDLISGQDVHRNSLLYAFSKIGGFFKSTYFRVLTVLTVLYCLGYFALWLYVQKEKRRRYAAMRRKRMEQFERRNRP
ncbi:MAG: D-alanyl-D-alanine carboxypeptidase family protein [Ruthenibacterium sp.]